MIEVSHLTKKYGDHTAVSDLSFKIEKGQIYGFLGPNGAGKSTTMNIMTGCLAATSGEVKIGGFDIFEEPKQAKKLIGYLPEIPPLYIDQTPREYLKFAAEAKGIHGKAALEAAIDEVVAEAHIEDVENKLIRHLSKGYRQRVGIAQALLGNPEVIILDEPTVGLDPFQIIEIRDLIRDLGKKHTVILSSHILPEVQAICQQVLIIDKGRLIAFDKPENLQNDLASDSTIEIKAETTREDMQRILQNIPEIISADDKESDEKTACMVLHVSAENLTTVCRSIFFAFAGEGKAILQMTPVKATLEDIFIELTGDDEKTAGNADKNTEESAKTGLFGFLKGKNLENDTDDDLDEDPDALPDKEDKE